MKKLIVTIIVLTCSNLVSATEQIPDSLHYNGIKLTMHTSWGYPSPLQTYYSQNKLDYPFIMLSTANYRGHVASWEVVEDKLYLKNIQIGDSLFMPQKYYVKSKDGDWNKDNSVYADWFSGVIVGQNKKDTYYFYVRYGEVKNVQIFSKKDYKKMRHISRRDTANHELMGKYFMLVLNQNYISYYYRLYEKDRIFINGENGWFENKIGYSPLLELYSNDHMKFPYNWENFEKSGAPNCRWSVVDDKIFLDKVQLYSGVGLFEIEKDSVELKSLFDENLVNDKVFAHWKIQCALTPCAKSKLTPENILFLTPKVS